MTSWRTPRASWTRVSRWCLRCATSVWTSSARPACRTRWRMTAFEPGSTYCIDGTTLKVWDGEDRQVSAELVQYSTGYKDPVQNAINCMRSAGFKFKATPPSELTLSNPEGGMPELPDDPTLLPEDDLMRLCFAFTEWTAYAESSLLVAQCDEGDLETKLSRARGKALAPVTGAKTVTAAKSAA